QVLHQLGGRYEGDTVSLKVQRDKETVEIKEAKLGSAVAAFNQPFLGILPMRDDPEPGVEVRFVFPDSPAAKAGIKEGDRLTKIGPNEMTLQPFLGRDQLGATLASLRPDASVSLEFVPKGGKEKNVKDIKRAWEDYCEKNKLILVVPISANETGWVANEMEFVNEATKAVMNTYTVDRRRVVMHGMGVGGQMAFYMGFAARDLV